MEPRTHRVTLHLDSGAKVVTEQTFPEDFEDEDVQNAVVQRIENRESPWKFIGHTIFNFRNVIAVEVEAIA